MIDEKKIASAAMSDEELDQVSGSSCDGTGNDSVILYKYGLIDDHFGGVYASFNWESKSKEVDTGWAKAGITCITKPFKDNKYFLDGKEISREEAIAHVKANFSKIRDWNA